MVEKDSRWITGRSAGYKGMPPLSRSAGYSELQTRDNDYDFFYNDGMLGSGEDPAVCRHTVYSDPFTGAG